MDNINLSRVTAEDEARAARIAREAGVDLDDCYQCGKCTAGCPMAHAMDKVPRQIIRLLQLGLTDQAIRAKSPWVCANCMVCSARCPQGVDVSALMLAVRHAGKHSGVIPEQDGNTFDDAFVANIRTFGKSNEAILAAKYNLLSGHLLQDVVHVPGMLAKGMIGPKIHGVKDHAAVRELVDRVRSRRAAATAQSAGAGKE